MAMKKCKECGTEISSSAKVCPNCGKKQKLSGCLIAIIIIVLLIIIIAISGNNNSSPTSTSSSESSTNVKTEETFNVGDTFSTNQFEITITSVETKTSIGSELFHSEPANGGIYIAVQYKYKNISNEPISSWSNPSLKLIDSNNVEYSSDANASINYATAIIPDRKVISDLNPGITVTDAVVFEISEESYNSNSWKLLIDADKDIYVNIK